jgi:hypothetical protein
MSRGNTVIKCLQNLKHLAVLFNEGNQLPVSCRQVAALVPGNVLLLLFSEKSQNCCV